MPTWAVGRLALRHVEAQEAGLSSAALQLATSRHTGKPHGDISRMGSV